MGGSAPHYRLDYYLYLPGNKAARFDFDPAKDFSGLKVGGTNHSRIIEWMDNLGLGPNTMGFDTTEQMLLAADQNLIDGFVATAQEMAILPGQIGLPGSYTRSRQPVFSTTAKAGVRNYNPGLLETIEQGFNHMSQAEKAGI